MELEGLSPLFSSVLSYFNDLHMLPTYFPKTVLMLIFHLCVSLTRNPLLCLPTKIARACYRDHPKVLYFYCLTKYYCHNITTVNYKIRHKQGMFLKLSILRYYFRVFLQEVRKSKTNLLAEIRTRGLLNTEQ